MQAVGGTWTKTTLRNIIREIRGKIISARPKQDAENREQSESKEESLEIEYTITKIKDSKDGLEGKNQESPGKQNTKSRMKSTRKDMKTSEVNSRMCTI